MSCVALRHQAPRTGCWPAVLAPARHHGVVATDGKPARWCARARNLERIGRRSEWKSCRRIFPRRGVPRWWFETALGSRAGRALHRGGIYAILESSMLRGSVAKRCTRHLEPGGEGADHGTSRAAGECGVRSEMLTRSRRPVEGRGSNYARRRIRPSVRRDRPDCTRERAAERLNRCGRIAGG